LPAWIQDIESWYRLASYAPSELDHSDNAHPGLAPWATFLRRFAASAGTVHWKFTTL
jgi:hypothetical protein